MTTISITILINLLYFHGEIISGTIFSTYLTLGSISCTVIVKLLPIVFLFSFYWNYFRMYPFHSKYFPLIIIPSSETRMTRELRHGQASPLSTSRRFIFMPKHPAPHKNSLHSLRCPDPFLLEFLYAPSWSVWYLLRFHITQDSFFLKENKANSKSLHKVSVH